MSEPEKGIAVKGGSKLPIPYTKARKKTLVSLQGEYQIKHKRKITVTDLAAAVFDEGLKTYRI